MQQYRTTDLGEAAALLTMETKLIGLEQSTNGRHKVFIFDTDKEAAERILSTYRSHQLVADVYKFFLFTKELKSRVMRA